MIDPLRPNIPNLVEVADDVWVDPYDVSGICADPSNSNRSLIFLRHGDPMEAKGIVANIVRRLGVMDR